jgi:hypothetical protein
MPGWCGKQKKIARQFDTGQFPRRLNLRPPPMAQPPDPAGGIAEHLGDIADEPKDGSYLPNTSRLTRPQSSG